MNGDDFTYGFCLWLLWISYRCIYKAVITMKQMDEFQAKITRLRKDNNILINYINDLEKK
jgi:hypothetical protein